MLGVVIAKGDKQLVIDLPASSAAMQAELASIDITVPIESVLLSDEEGEKIRIKLYASTPSSAHLLERADGDYPNGGKKEGIVVRPTEPVFCPLISASLSMKIVSNKYLLKNE